jgi:hypothetical protein
MDMTPLLHKPIIYGGGFAQSAFLVFVVVPSSSPASPPSPASLLRSLPRAGTG